MSTAKRLAKRLQNQAGQTATELMLVVSVVVIGAVAAAVVYVPTFQAGVHDLSTDVQYMLDTGDLNRKAGDTDGTQAQTTGKAPQHVPRFFDGMLEDAGKVSQGAALAAIAFLIAGLMWKARSGNLSASDRQAAEQAARLYAKAGGDPHEVYRAYNNIGANGGDVATAYAGRDGTSTKAVYHPGSGERQIILGDGTIVDPKAGGGTTAI